MIILYLLLSSYPLASLVAAMEAEQQSPAESEDQEMEDLSSAVEGLRFSSEWHPGTNSTQAQLSQALLPPGPSSLQPPVPLAEEQLSLAVSELQPNLPESSLTSISIPMPELSTVIDAAQVIMQEVERLAWDAKTSLTMAGWIQRSAEKLMRKIPAMEARGFHIPPVNLDAMQQKMQEVNHLHQAVQRHHKHFDHYAKKTWHYAKKVKNQVNATLVTEQSGQGDANDLVSRTDCHVMD